MSPAYVPEPRAGGAQPAPPEDGVIAHGHPPGRLGTAWARLLERIGGDARERVMRGKNHARRGRVRALEVGPGASAAEVVAESTAHPTVRVRTFQRADWDAVVAALHAELDLLAGLVEGDLAERLHDRLHQRGVELTPRLDDLSFDCDCGDFVMPCAHVGALLHTLGDAIDGDPFQLFTLRGRTRDQVLAGLRAALGDDAPPPMRVTPDEEAPPLSDWLSSPCAIPDFSCSLPATITAAGGLRALGPIPGAPDLHATLEPLYQAGAAAALHVIEHAPPLRTRRTPRPPGLTSNSPWERGDAEPAVVAPPPAPPPRPPEPVAPPVVQAPPVVAPPAAVASSPEPAVVAPPASPAPDATSAADQLLAALRAASGWTTTAALVEALGWRISDVRRELVAAEKAGTAERDARPDGVWWRAKG